MYIGRRDPEVQIIIPQILCDVYQAQDGRMFIEVFIPPENISEYQIKNVKSAWGSIMVAPTQVDILRKGSPYNVIRVNDGARIVCSVKDFNRKTISSEILLPEDIIGRLLKYYRFLRFVDEFIENDCVDELNTNSFDMYLDMLHIGQSMEVYMNRLPKML